MTPDPQDLRVENSLLRASLWLAARRLKDFLDAPHRKAEDDNEQLTIPATLREKAADALERANGLLVLKENEGPGR